jgi:hypothetical protein
MAVQSSMGFDLVKFMHDPISGDIDIDSIEELACEIIFRVFDGAVMITDLIDLDIRSFRDDGIYSVRGEGGHRGGLRVVLSLK